MKASSGSGLCPTRMMRLLIDHPGKTAKSLFYDPDREPRRKITREGPAGPAEPSRPFLRCSTNGKYSLKKTTAFACLAPMAHDPFAREESPDIHRFQRPTHLTSSASVLGIGKGSKHVPQ